MLQLVVYKRKVKRVGENEVSIIKVSGDNNFTQYIS